MGLRFRDSGLSYDDVLLVPKLGVLEHRADADLSTYVTNKIMLDIPIVSAPMTSITESLMASTMADRGGLGVIHRFMTPQEQRDEYECGSLDTPKPDNIACALGIKEDDLLRFELLFDAGCRIFVIDIAHAHCLQMKNFMEMVMLSDMAESSQFIVGNVGTAEGAQFLQDLGADAIKVGIGPGAACTTREVTGFGVPQLSAIAEIAESVSIPIMADGGIKTSGDIVKALAAGASTVMIGRLLAGTDEAAIPGEYFGMASRRMNGHNAPEGVEGEVERIGSANDVLKSLLWGIRSGISYAGARNIDELQDNAEFILVGYGAHVETATRI
jgi:IMP dehydrogenase